MDVLREEDCSVCLERADCLLGSSSVLLLLLTNSWTTLVFPFFFFGMRTFINGPVGFIFLVFPFVLKAYVRSLTQIHDKHGACTRYYLITAHAHLYHVVLCRLIQVFASVNEREPLTQK